MKDYCVKQLPVGGAPIEVSVPASKSILSRALVLSAFGEGDVLLKTGAFGDDTRDMLRCLCSLGIACEETAEGLLVHGTHRFLRTARLNVGSAGTCARFLPAVLAFFGGDYLFEASDLMRRRPMDLLKTLTALGADVEFLGEEGCFPFRLRSDGIRSAEIALDTSVSTQFSSALLLASALSGAPLTLTLEGPRTRSPYLSMTCALIRAFGGDVVGDGRLTILPQVRPAPDEFSVEPDLSAACYFYALALLLRRRVCVKGVRLPSLQGDAAFFELLKARSVRFEEGAEGLIADGTSAGAFDGFDEDLSAYSDQALTVAALAPFARTPSRLTGIGHIRRQECDRIRAISENLTALGVPCRELADGVEIAPAPVRGGSVKTFHDHRVAMSFSIIGLRSGKIVIDDPDCTAKTFRGFFGLLEKLS